MFTLAIPALFSASFVLIGLVITVAVVLILAGIAIFAPAVVVALGTMGFFPALSILVAFTALIAAFIGAVRYQ